MSINNRNIAFLVVLAALLPVLFLYALTIAPGLLHIDSGELAAVQATLGIAHPTGYPLFTVLGWLFLQLPLSLSPIFQLNILALTYTWVSLVLMAYWLFLVYEKLAKQIPDLIVCLAIAGICSLIGLGQTYWLQSSGTEVYSLHLLLLNALISTIIKAYFNPLPATNTRHWLIVALVLGFCFGNHFSTLFILPALAWLFFSKNGLNKNAFRLLSQMIGLFALVFAFQYTYLIIRAAQDPAINWGNPDIFKRFYRHLSAGQYRNFMFSDNNAASLNLKNFFKNINQELFFALYLFPLIPLSIVLSFKIHVRLALFFLVCVVFTVGYAVNYSIHDLETYFLLVYIVVAGWLFLAFLFINQYKKIRNVAALLIWGLVGLLGYKNFDKTNQSQNYIFQDYARTSLASLPQNSILLTYQWDFLVSQSYYLQFVEKFRPDILIVDKELLRRSWYFDMLIQKDSAAFASLNGPIQAFKLQLVPFESQKKFDSELLELYYRQIITGLLSYGISSGRPVFLGPEMAINDLNNRLFSLPSNTIVVPHLFFYSVQLSKTPYAPIQGLAALPAIRTTSHSDRYTIQLTNLLAQALTNRTDYELRNGQKQQAIVLLDYYKRTLPNKELPFDPKSF